ncbi:SxtJ family membrane protein [Mucilaginibacter endophyticus]|uniref:SxtJ family membrane protein n=1 Tax=Mucilaginibacter endophyticus TaxID=2675003 RepID=UPI000E0DA4EF|nr:SxtJ family membrane protein [Mucilaginibacter endophyticus]
MNSREANRKFGLIVGGACLSISAWRYVAYHQQVTWLFAIGILLVLAALITPLILNPLRLLWDRVGNFLGTINTTIILFVLYFLVITPIGLVMRLFKKSKLELRFDPQALSYWKPVKPEDHQSMKHQF